MVSLLTCTCRSSTISPGNPFAIDGSPQGDPDIRIAGLSSGSRLVTPDDADVAKVADAADVIFTVQADRDVRPISPLIYGINKMRDLARSQRGATLVRMGGNRLSTYNWENNASNAGADYHHQNDGYLVLGVPDGDAPAEAVRVLTGRALKANAAMMVTIPICGYVAADKDGGGDVNRTPSYLQARFKRVVARKGAPFSASPDLGDDAVYQDEFVAFMKNAFPDAFAPTPALILFSLDNEPDLWSHTHARIHPDPVTYRELVRKNVEFAAAIKGVAPNALVAGFVSYGYNGYTRLQGAPDQTGDFTEHWLDAMKQAEAAAGKRLVDILDLHWYPEAKGGGRRIIGSDTSPESVVARVQAPRSLWDPTYRETSWIADDARHGPIALIPSMQRKIADHYPRTKLGITEYYYGAGKHISGAIAQADVLGIFGREGVFLANLWELEDNPFMTYAALRAFRSYDGNGAGFGDTSVRASSSDVERATIYASLDAENPSRVVLVAINKTDAPLTAAVTLAAYGTFTTAEIHRITSAAADIVPAPAVSATGKNAFLVPLPPLSVSVLVPGT